MKQYTPILEEFLSSTGQPEKMEWRAPNDQIYKVFFAITPVGDHDGNGDEIRIESVMDKFDNDATHEMGRHKDDILSAIKKHITKPSGDMEAKLDRRVATKPDTWLQRKIAKDPHLNTG